MKVCVEVRTSRESPLESIIASPLGCIRLLAYFLMKSHLPLKGDAA